MKTLKYTTIFPALLISGGLSSHEKAEDPNIKIIERLNQSIKDAVNGVNKNITDSQDNLIISVNNIDYYNKQSTES
ncbi:hypothetical protein HUT03_00095 [Candidatus Liberibacter africanus]|uniref:Uncharacterized protein n=1 Tax=Candidatus Liberibacter africanus PTSAPSY TaxID=1277257 RepID=A0A0G3I5E6_LIBAF|nr:hypothetical protein [Candidatus Liberibacter africanus]AKK19683.1 hypothetical protein G293_00095 [Candidatus Liberibacter africanus PTSAPSY]QTP63569.1 hypothetical protein HUT03_00095 [Candidatus Liberibacter africanus]